MIWNPNTSSWDPDVIEVMFGDVTYDSTKCGYIIFQIPSMKSPPNTRPTTATFKLKILTNRSLNYSGSATEQAGMTQVANYVNGH